MAVYIIHSENIKQLSLLGPEYNTYADTFIVPLVPGESNIA